jgi:hypothetical protein
MRGSAQKQASAAASTRPRTSIDLKPLRDGLEFDQPTVVVQVAAPDEQAAPMLAPTAIAITT